MDDIALAELALQLAEQAAAEILRVRSAGFIVHSKADATPVTLADTGAERIIVAGLRAATPPRLGTTMEWDTAAPQAVLEAAGGSTRTFDGRTLIYGKPCFENPPFLCHGRIPA